ncbi:MAG: ABC transporter ATP-binding protein [Anaerolineales bacterium]
MSIILDTINLSKSYKSGSSEIVAVNDVSFQISKGEFVAMVGPSGSGKTTTVALLAGLLRPTSGKILIENSDLVQLSDKERTEFRRKNIGFTFQSNNLVPYLTALENVELMLRLNNRYNTQTADTAKGLLVRLGLEERLNNLPSQLSGGEQQRVAIARALIHQPILVLADEPTAALDSDRAYQVVEILSDLIHEQNLTAIMVTHDLRMIEYVDRVIQMRDGKIVNIISDREDINNLVLIGKREIGDGIPLDEIEKTAPRTGTLPNVLPSVQGL